MFEKKMKKNQLFLFFQIVCCFWMTFCSNNQTESNFFFSITNPVQNHNRTNLQLKNYFFVLKDDFMISTKEIKKNEVKKKKKKTNLKNDQ